MSLRSASNPVRALAARVALLAIACALPLFALAACGSGSESLDSAIASKQISNPAATHVHVSGELDIGSLALIKRAIRAAKSTDKRMLIIELDTGGGSIETMWEIQKQLVDAEENGVEIVTWIHNHSGSAGTIVVLSSRRVYMSSVGTVGAMEPVKSGWQGLEELAPGIREKLTSFLRAQVAAAAEKYGRPPALAMAMVDMDCEVRQVRIDGELRLITGDQWDTLREKGTPLELVDTIVPRGRLLDLPAQRAVELRFADGIADSLAQVLAKLGLPPESVGPRMELSAPDEFAVWLHHWMPLFLIVAFVLAYIEMKIPGFGIAGILSIACFALALTGQYLTGLADVPHIAAVALGAALIAVEVFVFPGTLWLGITGAILVVGGLVLGSVGPSFEFGNLLDQRLVVDAAFRILGSAALALVAAFALSRVLPKTPMLRRAVLAPGGESTFAGAMPEASGGAQRAAQIGAIGRVVSDLRPVGKVELDSNPGYEYEARSSGRQIQRDARVRVIEVSAARLVVESVAGEEAPGTRAS